MSGNQERQIKFDILRQQAQALINQQPDSAFSPPADMLELINELRVYQAELEIQNEELQRAQNELSQVRDEFKDLYDFAPCGYVTLDPNGAITRVNLSAVTLLNVNRARILNTRLTQYMDVGWQDSYLAALQKAGRTGEKQILDLQLKNGSALPVWVGLDIQADRTETDEVIQWRVVMACISERKKWEEILQISEERFRTMFENISSGAAVYEPVDDGADFIFQDLNPAAEKITRISKNAAVGKRLLDIFPNMGKTGLLQALRQTWKTGEKVHLPPFYYQDQVRQGWRENHICKLPSGEIVAIFDDVTGRIVAEQALRNSEKKYRSMIEAMRDATYICSPDLRIEYMNPRMISKVGFDATGRICYQAIYGKDKPCAWCVFDEVRQGEYIDYELADPDDNRYYAVSNSPLYQSEGSIYKLTILRDITAIKATEAQLRHASKMESIGTLTGGIAHDFNNLLYMILGNAELAIEDVPQWSPVHDNLEEIKTASLKASSIVRQLLNFSRNKKQELKPIGIISVIRDTLKLLRSTLPATVEMQTILPDTDVTVVADSTQISQVLINIFTNAGQAMENTGGIIEIKAESTTLTTDLADHFSNIRAGAVVKITIRDTGPGINADIIERIFDPYFTTKEFGKGSGMGLSVAHGIVKNHGGAITADSRLGKGATFTIVLPATVEPAVEKMPIPDEMPRGNETILFVDDEKSIVKMAAQLLRGLGYAVDISMDPVQALELFRSAPGRFDLVITDMTMPHMTGVGLSEKLREIRRNIPVIICTGHSVLIDAQKAQEREINALVMKPIVRQNMANTIRSVLDEAKSNIQTDDA